MLCVAVAVFEVELGLPALLGRAGGGVAIGCGIAKDRGAELLVDQGDADPFLAEQLKPHLLAAACSSAGIPLTLRMQAGYDHSYHFISTFMADHVAWHAQRLNL